MFLGGGYDKDVTQADLGIAKTFNTQDTSVGNTTALSALNEITTVNHFANTSIVAPYGSSAGWYFKFKGENNIAQQEKVFYSLTVIDYDLILVVMIQVDWDQRVSVVMVCKE